MPTTFEHFDRSFRADHRRILYFARKLSAELCIKWLRESMASVMFHISHRLGKAYTDRIDNAYCKLLTKFEHAVRYHEHFEEEIFYPFLRKKLGDKAPIDETEHAQLDKLLTQLSENKKLSEKIELMKTLQKAMTVHFDNEETTLLPVAQTLITERECRKMNQKFEQIVGSHIPPRSRWWMRKELAAHAEYERVAQLSQAIFGFDKAKPFVKGIVDGLGSVLIVAASPKRPHRTYKRRGLYGDWATVGDRIRGAISAAK